MVAKTVSAEFVRDHVCLDMKFLADAAVRFKPGSSYEVALAYSAFASGRSLLDFFVGKVDARSASVRGCYPDPKHRRPASPQNVHDWYAFISARVVHVGFSRACEKEMTPGGKTDDRFMRLAVVVIELAELNTSFVRDDCRPTFEAMAARARQYLGDPTDAHLNDLDPSHLPPAMTPEEIARRSRP